MRARHGQGRPLARTLIVALLCGQPALVAVATAAPPAMMCLTSATGSPSCTAGDAAGAPGSSVPPDGAGLHVGNPIEVTGGNKYQRDADYRAFGTGLAFVRHYNSLLADEDLGLGPGWRHTYDISLAAIRGGGMRLRQSDGRTLDFSPSPGTRRPEVHVGASPSDGLITHEDGRSSWYLPDGRRFDFRGPKLVRLDWGDARGALDVRYRDGRVARVTDRLGRSLNLHYVKRSEALPAYGDAVTRYRPPGALDALELPDGTRVRFEYDARRPLDSVVHPDGRRIDYGYTDTEWLPPLLSLRRVTPIGGTPPEATETRWRYDDDGLAVGVEGAVGLEIERVPSGPHAGVATVRWNDGRTRTTTWSADGATTPVGRGATIRSDDAPPTPAAARRRTALDAMADVALATLRTGPDEGASALLATLPLPDGTSALLRLRADNHGNLDLLQLGPTDLQEVLAHAAAGALPTCGTHRPDDAAIVARLVSLAGGDAPCATDVLATFALEDSLERRQDASAADASEAARIVPDPPFEPRRMGTGGRGGRGDPRDPGGWGGTPGRPPAPPDVVQGPEPSACDMPPGKDCPALVEDHEMALLSDCAYDNGCASDWRRMDPAEIGLDDIDFHDAGFDAELYHDAATGRYTLAFRGTDGVGDDWVGTNLAQGRGQRTRQYDLAYELTSDVLSALPGADLSFTGHSLGGGLATFAALSARREATVFNAAALHPATARREGLEVEYAEADRYIDLITIHDDPVTALARTQNNLNLHGGRFTPGRHTVLANPSETWVDRNYSGGGPLDDRLARHSMAAVIEQLEVLLSNHCGGVP